MALPPAQDMKAVQAARQGVLQICHSLSEKYHTFFQALLSFRMGQAECDYACSGMLS
jgi:hypothetical protein